MRKWLKSSLIGVLSLVMFAGCSLPIGGGQTSDTGSVDSVQENNGYYTVKFELCTNLKTNIIEDQEVEEGDIVVKPSVGVIGENPDRMEIDGWYTDAEYTNVWNFTTDSVEEDMTLYAKWVKKYAVTFYLGDETDVPMIQQFVKEGECLKDYEKYADGYESDGFFTNARFTERFDPTKPITCDQNVYIHRSAHIYFSGKMIAERFNMFAAPSGEGSKAGTIEYKEEEGTGEGYAEINFGYSTATDPYALLSGVTVDVSASQKLEVTFRNLGKATSLKFYYLNWMADGSYVDGQSFNENNTFTYKYEPDEIEMDETDEWVTKTFDFAEVITNGVSNWGISATMIQLRIQSSYISENAEDLSNIVQIKSIKGIPDDTYTSTEDTERVAMLRVDDDATAVQEAADAQADVCGWVFPKDYSCAVANNATLYEKTNGVLFYSNFRAKNAGVTFKLADIVDENGEPVLDENGKTQKEEISLDEKTAIRIRLTNYGYSNKLTLTYKNSYGFAMSKQLNIAPCGDEPQSKEYVLNMFGEEEYNGILDTIGFSYDSIGVDNAILIECVEFLDFKMIDIPGVNFNDKYAGDETKNAFWTTTNAVTIAHNGGLLSTGGTVFTTETGAYVERETSITNLGYETMTLKYKDVTGVRNVIVTFTIGGVESEYNYDLMSEEMVVSGIWNTLTLPLTAKGQIERVRVAFVGEAGTITLQELRFNMDRNSGLDFSISTYVEQINAKTWSGDIISYDNSTSSAVLSAKYNESNGDASAVRYYYNAIYESDKLGEGNVDISNKSKIIVIYNNTGNVKSLNVGLGLVNVTEDSSWKVAHSEIGSPGSGGYKGNFAVKTNMAEGEWEALEIDLSVFNTLEESTEGRAVNLIGIQQADKYSTENILIRAIIIL